MNRIYNSWTFLLAIPTLIYAFLDALDQNYHIFHQTIDFIKNNFHHELFLVVAILILLINTRRSIKKWYGIFIVNQKDKYIYNEVISGRRKNVVIVKNLLEMIGFALLLLAYFFISTDAYLITIILAICLIDMAINSIAGLLLKKYRIGMTNKAIVAIDREVNVIYFKGLRKLMLQDNILYFDYVNDLVLDLPLNYLNQEEQSKLIDLIRTKTDKTKVYFSGFE